MWDAFPGRVICNLCPIPSGLAACGHLKIPLLYHVPLSDASSYFKGVQFVPIQSLCRCREGTLTIVSVSYNVGSRADTQLRLEERSSPHLPFCAFCALSSLRGTHTAGHLLWLCNDLQTPWLCTTVNMDGFPHSSCGPGTRCSWTG